MELLNRLPLSAVAFRQFDADGKLDCVVSVRGTFGHVQSGQMRIGIGQEDFQWEDRYDGEAHEGVLLRQTDLTPEKAGTDITFLGSSYAPGGEAMKTWCCRIAVGNVEKSLRLHGKRVWEPVLRERWAGLRAPGPERRLVDWRLGNAEPARAVELSWKNAYGGKIPGSDIDGGPLDVNRSNPLGCGIVNLDMGIDSGPCPAPSITATDEIELDWRDSCHPEGFGPVSPWWHSRQQFAGTYDDAWLNERHPLQPRDFDARFWQSAPPDLVAIPWLIGNERYVLENLDPDLPLARGELPGIQLGVNCKRRDRDDWYLLNLDGVHFDWRHDRRVIMTWRARFPLQDASNTVLTLCRVVLSDGQTANTDGQAA